MDVPLQLTIYTVWLLIYTVSILVLMDVPLQLLTSQPSGGVYPNVSILVLMDVPLQLRRGRQI